MLLGTDGTQWSSRRPDVGLISKPILMAHLAAFWIEVELINMRKGKYQEEIGQLSWKGHR
jgi:hypothetical protein